MPDWAEQINWNDDGLVPVIVQESGSGRILMHAWMNQEALEKTISCGNTVFWSRSRATLWTKGESSGHFQQVKSIQLDCDGDTLLITVEQQGGVACHTGRHSCFFRTLDKDGWQLTEEVIKDPGEIYK